jgi:hypothetical protein
MVSFLIFPDLSGDLILENFVIDNQYFMNFFSISTALAGFMLDIRVVKTKGNSRSVQVYYYRNSRRVIVKHVGSDTREEEIVAFLEIARLFLVDFSKQGFLFEENKPREFAVLLSQCQYKGFPACLRVFSQQYLFSRNILADVKNIVQK